ncbi:interferon-induced protein 44-like [Sorex araneus]|uniref:interferon-induced protein 44-like n=1 Tax=Sorex araneus TaxID=42254 RepID=UPI002433E159|nr:interferon-induced protein 44-like [Sorex araneus]
MALTTSLPWNVEKRLQKFLENVSFTLLYTSKVHQWGISEFLTMCASQGPTLTVFHIDSYIVGVLMTGNYPRRSENSVGPISSLFFSYICDKKSTMSTEFLNIKHIRSHKSILIFDFFDNNTFHFNPYENKFILHDSLAKKLLGYSSDKFIYRECEVFRVEGIKFGEGYLSKLARAEQHRHSLLEDLRNFKVYRELFSEIHILLLGPIGSGKSSFCNSVKSIFQGHVTRQAPVGSDFCSITEQYRKYSIGDGKYGKSLPFVLCDTMGLDDTEGAGLCVDDIPHILKGSMPDRYQFNPQKSITPQNPTFITSPSLKDRIHCVAFVLDIKSTLNLSSEMVAKLKQIQKEVLNHGISLVALITKLKDCSDIQDNFLSMNKFITSSPQIVNFSKMLNIPMYNIFMVQNYASELELYPLKDILILTALKQMLRAANAALEDLPLEEPV